MFALFRFRSADRYFLLAVFFVLTRIGMWLGTIPYVVPDISLWLVGERILAGKILYKDVLTDCSPFTALVYTLLSAVAPRSQLVSTLLASGLVFLQALYFNRILLKFGQIDDRSIMPAAMYLVLANACFDFSTLSSPLLALTALLPVLSRVFMHVRFGLEEHRVHENGVLIGIAALFYWPAAVFVFFLALAMLLYTGTVARWYAVMLIGFLLPFLVAGFGFYFADALDGFLSCYVFAPFSIAKNTYVTGGMLVFQFLLPVAFVVWAALRTLAHRGYINFVAVSNTILVIWAGAALLSYPFSTWQQPACFWFLVPPAAYFLAQWSYLVSKTILRELWLTALLAYTVLVFYLPYLPLNYLRQQFMNQGLVAFYTAAPTQTPKLVWVAGNRPQAYLGNLAATPFLDYRLSAPLLLDTLHYASRLRVYQAFSAEMPAKIIDADSSVGSFLNKMPILAKAYVKKPGTTEWHKVKP